jgi:hypothetical protein
MALRTFETSFPATSKPSFDQIRFDVCHPCPSRLYTPLRDKIATGVHNHELVNLPQSNPAGFVPHTPCIRQHQPKPRSHHSQKLTAPTEIEGHPCAAAYAWFFNDGKLPSCFVSREAEFGKLTVPKQSWIFVGHDATPRFVFLAHDAAVNGHLCRGGGNSYSTALYPDGSLRICWLAVDSEINGVPCMRANFAKDVFVGGVGAASRPNGALHHPGPRVS